MIKWENCYIKMVHPVDFVKNLRKIITCQFFLVMYYIELCSINERNGSPWMKSGVWKLRGIRRGWEKRGMPPMQG
jgi:hypothetical protein